MQPKLRLKKSDYIKRETMSDEKKKPVKRQNRPSTRLKKKLMIRAMEQTLGNVSASIKAITPKDSNNLISRETHYKWLKEDEKYATAIEAIAEGAIDMVETKLLQNIRDGKETSTIFFLKTKAKHRGYIETNHNINTDVSKDDLEDATEEELLAIINRKV